MQTETARIEEGLFEKLQVLNERLWEDKVRRPAIERWLANFAPDDTEERLHALFLLSEFLYYGEREVKQLLRVLYREHFRSPLLRALRAREQDTHDAPHLIELFEREQAATRFAGAGRAAESGSYLLYPFRQVNGLPVNLFCTLDQLLSSGGDGVLRREGVRKVVFIDDLCGSGTQIIDFAEAHMRALREASVVAGSELEVDYLTLVARDDALARVRCTGQFDQVAAVLELDNTHRALSPESRHFASAPSDLITCARARELALAYGRRLVPEHPLGWNDGQLLLGFHHNVPDNTLPIIWWPDPGWEPIFPRAPKT